MAPAAGLALIGPNANPRNSISSNRTSGATPSHPALKPADRPQTGARRWRFGSITAAVVANATIAGDRQLDREALPPPT